MRPIIFINGPPGSGKDTLGIRLAQVFSGFKIVKFAQVLKERTHALYGYDLTHDFFEHCKNEPNDIFMGKTPREAYIGVSERYFKPLHGEEILGKLLLHKIVDELFMAKGFIVTDSGFESEVQPLIRHFGRDSCLLVRIHAEGRGCTFEKDSRSHIDLPVETLDIANNGTKESFLSFAQLHVAGFVQGLMAGEFI